MNADRPLFPPERLETARLLLRPWQPADAPALLRVLREEHDRLVRDFPRTLAAVTDEASAAEFVTERQRLWAERLGFQYALWNPADPTRALGFVSLRDLKWNPLEAHTAEVAYFIAGHAEGQGLMREALRAAMAAFFGLGLEKIFARVLPANEASRQVLLAVGFRFGGSLRCEFRTGTGHCVDVDYFDLLPGEVTS